MRRTLLLGLPLLLAADAAAAEQPACGASALLAAPDVWDSSTAVTGDVTLDGNDDIVYWKRDGNGVLLFIVSCDGETVQRSWRLRVALGDCPPDASIVQVASLLLEPARVERVCTTGDASECAHLRRENARRQALVDAGGRDLLVGGSACAAQRVRWSTDLGGWMVLPEPAPVPARAGAGSM